MTGYDRKGYNKSGLDYLGYNKKGVLASRFNYRFNRLFWGGVFCFVSFSLYTLIKQIRTMTA
jgi:hypothetical protein